MRKGNKLAYDPLTEQIQHLLIRIPKVGALFARLYLWRAMMFNFMLVGSTGLVISWILYECVFRALFLNLWGGTFLGMTITTTLVFFWNYALNKRWSLNSTAQIMGMKKAELETLRETINKLLLEKRFDANGSRI